jgi:hypothetical protein
MRYKDPDHAAGWLSGSPVRAGLQSELFPGVIFRDIAENLFIGKVRQEIKAEYQNQCTYIIPVPLFLKK